LPSIASMSAREDALRDCVRALPDLPKVSPSAVTIPSSCASTMVATSYWPSVQYTSFTVAPSNFRPFGRILDVADTLVGKARKHDVGRHGEPLVRTPRRTPTGHASTSPGGSKANFSRGSAVFDCLCATLSESMVQPAFLGKGNILCSIFPPLLQRNQPFTPRRKPEHCGRSLLVVFCRDRNTCGREPMALPSPAAGFGPVAIRADRSPRLAFALSPG
jgi:hypothetical protein